MVGSITFKNFDFEWDPMKSLKVGVLNKHTHCAEYQLINRMTKSQHRFACMVLANIFKYKLWLQKHPWLPCERRRRSTNELNCIDDVQEQVQFNPIQPCL
jgi:hypothetical protein